MSAYLSEFEECQFAFDAAFPGERASEPRLALCPHWDEFRSAWLETHPFHKVGEEVA